MTHPDDVIAAEFKVKMQALAETIDELFNGNAKGDDRKVCFVVLVTEFTEIGADGEGRVNYISNGNRESIVTMMKETISRFEGYAEPKVGRA